MASEDANLLARLMMLPVEERVAQMEQVIETHERIIKDALPKLETTNAQLRGELAMAELSLQNAQHAEQEALWAYRRLEIEAHTLRKIAAAVARDGLLAYRDEANEYYCLLCGETIQAKWRNDEGLSAGDYADEHLVHAPDCIVLVARAWANQVLREV